MSMTLVGEVGPVAGAQQQDIEVDAAAPHAQRQGEGDAEEVGDEVDGVAGRTEAAVEGARADSTTQEAPRDPATEATRSTAGDHGRGAAPSTSSATRDASPRPLATDPRAEAPVVLTTIARSGLTAAEVQEQHAEEYRQNDPIYLLRALAACKDLPPPSPRHIATQTSPAGLGFAQLATATQTSPAGVDIGLVGVQSGEQAMRLQGSEGGSRVAQRES